MAYRKSQKIEPAVLEHYFNLPAGISYVDLNQVNSLVNRRFYRQGLQNAVASIEVQFTPNPGQTAATGDVIISKLPATWVLANAYKKGLDSWMKMNREAMAETESVRPKFLDFKIFMDSDHHAAGSAANLKPTSGPGGGMLAVPATGEWDYSKVYTPRASDVVPAVGTDNLDEWEIIATGANFPGAGASGLNAVSLIEGYAASRGLPYQTDPNVPADASDVAGGTPHNWMGAMFNEGTTQDHEVIEDMITENNVAPYPFENGPIQGFPGTFYTDTMYPGGANQIAGVGFHDKLLITTSTVGGSDTAIGGVFPCGLIRFDTTITNGSAQLIIRLVPGNHRGYLCEPMKEM